MNMQTLQGLLAAQRAYSGPTDGIYGPITRAGVMKVMTMGPDTPVGDAAIARAAQTINVTPAHILAVRAVEASGMPFVDGSPTILFEPHRFSRATGGRFDQTHPDVSYPHWDRSRYPTTQAGRYDQLLTAVGLDVDAGFASASYGAFQILGENYRACGCGSPFAFALAEAQDELNQLLAFCRFVDARGLDEPLRRGDWQAFADGYNGSASRLNRYAARLEAAFRKAGGR